MHFPNYRAIYVVVLYINGNLYEWDPLCDTTIYGDRKVTTKHRQNFERVLKYISRSIVKTHTDHKSLLVKNNTYRVLI